MKKVKWLLLGLAVMAVGMPRVLAASTATASVSSSSIENGSTVRFNLRLSAVAGWDVKINSSGNTNGCSQHFVDDSGTGKNTTKTLTVTCRATSIGIINFSYSGTIADANLEEKKISGSRAVTVTAVRPKSTNSDLKSLRVEGYEISPAFDKDTLEYSLTVNNDVTKINVLAEKADNYAKISNYGEIDVSEGENKISIIVTAENGSEKTYIINVTVKELNPIIVNVNGKDYTIVKKVETMTKPESYEERMINYNDVEIPAFYSEMTDFTLIGMKDDSGTVSLFIYNENENSYILYEEIKFLGITFYSMDGKEHMPKGYEECSVDIYGVETIGYCKDAKDKFILVYGMNVANGNKGLYVFDQEEKTLQRYNESLINDLEKVSNTYLMAAIIFGGALFLLIILFIVIIMKKGKKKKIKKEEVIDKEKEAKKTEK